MSSKGSRGTGRDLIGSRGAEVGNWAQIPHELHMSSIDLAIPGQKMNSLARRRFEAAPEWAA